MSMLFREIGVLAERPLKTEDAAVENMSRVVCALLIQGLNKKLKTPDFWKVSIRINDRDTSENGKIIGGVVVWNRNFPTTEFLGWSLETRQTYMLKFVSKTLRDVFIERGLDTHLIDDL
jgi:hypothetical protein